MFRSRLAFSIVLTSLVLTAAIVAGFTLMRASESIWILLLGSDQRAGDEQARFDTIQLARIEFNARRISLIAIPRDLYIEHGGFSGKIGHIERSQLGSPIDSSHQLIRTALIELTGQQIDHVAVTDMQGLRTSVDMMGGVDIVVDCPFEERFSDFSAKPQTFSFRLGRQHLNGLEALAFARFRRIGGDLSRAVRQQRLLGAMQEKIDTLNPLQQLNIFWLLQRYVKSTLSFYDRVRIALLLAGIKSDQIAASYLTNDQVVEYIVPSNGQRALRLKSGTFNQIVAQPKDLLPIRALKEDCAPASIQAQAAWENSMK